MMQTRTVAGLIFFTSFATWAQQPAFEVASVKPAPPPTDGRMRVGMSGDAGRVNFSNVTLINIMTRAYNVKDKQISGPDWLKSERYDIAAKLPAGAPKDQIPAMLQTLLADRFKLALHRETKVLPVYALVVGKSGPKLHQADAEGGLRVMMGPKGHKMTGSVSIARLADTLSTFMDQPVLDMTELKGNFDIDLDWTADGPTGGPGFFGPGGGESKAAPDNTDAPSIFTAVQEKLGLRLESRKSPVEILIVDRAERVPTEN